MQLGKSSAMTLNQTPRKGNHDPKVHVGTKRLPEVYHVDSALALRAQLVLAAEVNAKETRQRRTCFDAPRTRRSLRKNVKRNQV